MSQIVAVARVLMFAVALAAAGRGWLAAAQMRDIDLKEFESSMVEVGEAFEVADEMTPSPAFLLNSVRGDLLARVDAARGRMEFVRKFFAARKKPEGVTFAEDAVAAMDAFRRELTIATPDQASAIESLDAVTRACAACHDVYREGDKDTGYRFKAGTL